MLKIDPFGFFHLHASAFAGLGGQEPSPDPRYCFHTTYQTLPEGQARFEMMLRNLVSAPCELNVRVMALGSDNDAVMATSLRIDLDGETHKEMKRSIRFLAVEDVQYALYAFLTEPAEIAVSAIEIGLVSLIASSPGPNRRPARSRFADRELLVKTGKLFAPRVPTLARPMSQAYTREQGRTIAQGSIWPEVAREGSSALECWKRVMPLAVLEHSGLIEPPVTGAIIDPPGPALAAALAQRGCEVRVIGGPDAPEDEAADLYGACDFVIGYAPPGPLNAHGEFMDEILERMAEGGLAVAVYPVPAAVGELTFRNSIQQIAFRLIGKGHSVAQIALADGQPWLIDGMDGAFALVVRK